MELPKNAYVERKNLPISCCVFANKGGTPVRSCHHLSIVFLLLSATSIFKTQNFKQTVFKVVRKYEKKFHMASLNYEIKKRNQMRSKILMDTVNMYTVILICHILIIIQNTNYGIGRGIVSFCIYES